MLRKLFGVGGRACLVCAFVTLAAPSCVKLPRDAHLAGGQNAPPPEAVEAKQAGAEKSPAATVNLNTASREELESLPGVGQALAGRILEHRMRYGAFRRVEHLLMVRGISVRRFRQMRALIRAE